MSSLDEAIKKAVDEQYPTSRPASPGKVILIKSTKQSERKRWTEHFILQLLTVGLTVADPATFKSIVDSGIDPGHLILREYRFHPSRMWRFDFANLKAKLAIEIEGGVWRRGGGAHSHPTNIMRDIEKSNHATMLGWHLLRFTDKEIRSGESIQMTVDFLKK